MHTTRSCAALSALLVAAVLATWRFTAAAAASHRYAEFPFAAFRSYSLREARRTVFTDRYLLASTELNVLNVILSQER